MLPDEGSWPASAMRAAPKATGRGCCAWRSGPPGARGPRGAGLAAGVSGVYADGRGICGAPKVFAGLGRAGASTPRRRAARTVRENGWSGAARGRAKRPKGAAKPAAPRAGGAPGLVRRGFGADGPNRARFAGVACVRTRRGWLHLAVAMGIWPRTIVGRSMPPGMAAGPADGAPKMAMARRGPPAGCVRHSGRGPQHAPLRLGRTVRDAGVESSTGPVSGPWDDAAMESPMGLVKAERVHARTFESRDQAALGIFGYVERFCNGTRMHSALGDLSPGEFEAKHMEDAAPVAA